MTERDTKFKSWLTLELVITGMLVCAFIYTGYKSFDYSPPPIQLGYFIGICLFALRFYRIFDLMQEIDEPLRESVEKSKEDLLSIPGTAETAFSKLFTLKNIAIGIGIFFLYIYLRYVFPNHFYNPPW